jgi:superoxide dismutase, Cu-Zn family
VGAATGLLTKEGAMAIHRPLAIIGAAVAMALAAPAAAEQAAAEMHAVSADGVADPIGTIQLTDGDNGLVLETDLSGLPPGAHGFHLHTHGNCEPAHNDQGQMTAALAAGGHYDPDNTGKHAGPEGDGHKGDLPVLEVAPDGIAQVTLTAPRLTVTDARGRALMIHAGGDNYSDEPKPLGGGGARIACGVVN